MFFVLLLAGCEALSLPGGVGAEVGPKSPGAPTSCTTRTWYADPDGDGVGTADTTLEDWQAKSCTRPLGYVSPTGDCDDDNHLIHPHADEICDGVDNDCDGDIDAEDADVLGNGPWYTDADGDGYGAIGKKQRSCEQPSGTVARGGDCDDSDPAYHPGAEEKCGDPTDFNCDGSADTDDDDGDGWLACEDCDDGDSAIGPTASEICDGDDNDCDGEIDESGAIDAPLWYEDSDGDGYGDEGTTQTACTQPSGYTDTNNDCNDADYDVHPDAVERCNDVDDDCDGEFNEPTAQDASDWYYDGDGDGEGVAERSLEACAAPSGFVASDDDCDDHDASAYPDAVESCDTVDNDCDGDVDEDSIDATTWYEDDDGDGFGDPDDTLTDCRQPTAFVSDGTDCDDQDGDIYPGGLESCDGDDGDCDGSIDEGATDALIWYRDADSDGFRDENTTDDDCEQPDGYLAGSAAIDCDDNRADVNPDADEYCDGSADEDCDGTVDEDGAADVLTWYADSDSDSFGDPDNTDVDCEQPGGYVSDDTDCDDGASTTYPGADEYCDGTDTDCDGTLDEDDALDALTFYADTDSDGYGDAGNTYAACEVPGGYVSDDTDCDDGAAATYPGADEYCDGTDTDCDGTLDEDDALDVLTWYNDGDSDGYGDAGTTDIDCAQPAGYVSDATDCDDARSDVNPGAHEVCDDATDEDCDSTIDEDGAVDARTWYADDDIDAYGDPGVSDVACDQPAGYVSDNTDCDDGDELSNPGGTEICDGADEDCDGSVDEIAAEVDDLYDNDCDEYVDEDFLAAGDVIINELMIDPMGTDSTGEWFELHNISSRDVRLDGWEIAGTDTNSPISFWITPDIALTVEAGGYLLFCRDVDGIGTTGLDCDYVYRSDQGYADSVYGAHHATQIFTTTEGDILTLLQGATVIDEFAYSESFVPASGYSMELSTNHADDVSNDTESNWCVADSGDLYNTNYGTPGTANTCAL